MPLGAALWLAACDAGTGTDGGAGGDGGTGGGFGSGGGKAWVVTAIGDVAFARNRVLSTADSPAAWARYTDQLKPLVIGDLNFLNLEAVVTDSDLGPGRDKAFTFQMHTTGLRHLVEDLGFNLMSTANNHSGDFGHEGQVRTLAALEALEALAARDQSLIHHGLGTTAALEAAARGQVRGQSVAFAAIGISAGAPRPTSDRPGQWNVHVPAHWQATLQGLKTSEAAYRVLSTHEGIERQSTPEAGVRARFRAAQQQADLDLILAHHPHVPRGVEIDAQGRVIAYGLGNGLLHGAANLAGRGEMSDFGLMLRLYYAPAGVAGRGGRSQSLDSGLEAVEAIPLTAVHFAPRPFATHRATRDRITALNSLSRAAAGERAMIFRPQADTGFGLWCAPVQRTAQARALCQSLPASTEAPEPVAPEPEASEAGSAAAE